MGVLVKKLILVVASIVLLLALVGCGGAKSESATGSANGGPGTIVNEAKDNAAIAACRTNRALLDQQYAMAQSAGDAPADFATVLSQSGAKCPSGGTYSLDATTGKARCSIHGE
jgi:hypothetical protein